MCTCVVRGVAPFRDSGQMELMGVELSGNVPVMPRSANTDLFKLKYLELHAFLLNCSLDREYNLASGIWLPWEHDPMPLGVSDLRLTNSGLPCIRRLWELHRGAAHPGNVLWKGFLVFGALFSFGDRYLRIQTLTSCVSIFFVRVPNKQLNTFLFLRGVTFFVFAYSDSSRTDIYIKSNCDLEFYQWIHIFQNLCSVSHISCNVCFWMKGLFNLPTQCECASCLLQWRSCSWRHISDNNFDFLLFEMQAYKGFHDISENFAICGQRQTQKKKGSNNLVRANLYRPVMFS